MSTSVSSPARTTAKQAVDHPTSDSFAAEDQVVAFRVAVCQVKRQKTERRRPRHVLGEVAWRSGLAACIWFLVLSLIPTGPVQAQTADPEQIADRFLQVLLRRPRPGTALDRVFSYHTQNESLEPFLSSLDVSRDVEKAGEKQMILGLIQSLRGNTSAAIKALQKAEEWLPGDPMASYSLAKAMVDDGDSLRAIEPLQRAIERKPDRREAAEIYLELGRLQLRHGQSEQAITTWTQLIEQYPNDNSIIEKVASWLTQQQEFKPALDLYERLAKTAKSPDSRIRYQIQAAEIRGQLGQTERSRNDLQGLLDRLRPGSWLHHDVRSRIERSFLVSGDVEALIDYYNGVADRSPDNLDALNRLGEILAGAGREKEAEQAFRRAIARAPDNVLARVSLVEILSNRGRAGAAAEQLEILLDQDPSNPDYLMRLGEILLNDTSVDLEERVASAARAWDRLASSRADDAVTLAALAKKMHSIEKTERAIELYRAAINADPDGTQYREYLGEYLHRLGRKDEAIEAWRSIAGGPRRNRVTLVRLAEVLQASNYLELSLEVWRQAAELDLTFDERLRYATSLSESERYDEAFAQIESASSQIEDPEQEEKLLRQRIELLAASGKIRQRIGEVSIEQPTAKNQRFLALLLQADGQLAVATQAIDRAADLAPQDLVILRDAVAIAEESRQLTKAADLLNTLAKSDTRFRINHLRRRVQILEQLGQLDGALEAAQQMIDANPASPDAYRVHAQIAFALGKDSDGERSLRRAIVVSPREVAPRITLAERLAKRFQTPEAISLFWEAIEFEPSLSTRKDLIRQLVPLYARRGEIDDLVGRIERFDANLLAPKDKQILTASVWSSVQDYKQAQIALRSALTKQPRDPDLLEAMVDSLLESGDTKSAVNFQRRLVQANDSSSNQARLISLELNAGLITEQEARAREIKATDDPKRMARIAIRGATQDPEQAAALCEVVLQKRPELWDVKIVRAQLLLLSDSPDRAEDLAEADRLATDVYQLNLEDDERAPAEIGLPPSTSSTRYIRSTRRLPITRVITPGTRIAPGQPLLQIVTAQRQLGSALNRRVNSNDPSAFPQLTAQTLQLIQGLNERRIASRANSGQKSYSFAFGSNYVKPDHYDHARWISVSVQVIAECQIAKLSKKSVDPAQVIEKRFPSPGIESTDLAALRDSVKLHSVKSVLSGNAVATPENLIWRIAELDPTGDHPDLSQLLSIRSKVRQSSKDEGAKRLAPLTDSQLNVLTRLCEEHQRLAYSEARSVEKIMSDLQLRQSLIAECRLAGRDHPFSGGKDQTLRNSGFSDSLAEIQAALWEKNIDDANRLVAGLVRSAREIAPGDLSKNSVPGWLASPTSDEEVELLRLHRDTLIDAWLAYCSRRMVLSQGGLPPSDLFDGQSLQLVVPKLKTGLKKPEFELFRLTMPFSKRLFDDRLMRGLVVMIAGQSTKSARLSLSTPDDLIERLQSPLDGATPHEQKLRRIVAAFAAWWDNRPFDCYLQLDRLADEYPDDVDLQIEAARLAVVAKRSKKGFERLNRINATDDATRNQVAIARIVLAAKTGDDGLVRSSANQLLARPIDASTRTFLLTQLQKHATRSQAMKTLGQAISQAPYTRPTPRVIRNDDKDRMELAEALLESGDATTASEVAYSIIYERQSSSKVDRSATRRRAIEILAQTGRLQPLIATTERKFRAAPNSDAYRQELADLYVAAGQPEKASTLWKQVIEALNLSPRQIVIRASAMRGRRDYHHAAMLYLYAFKADPELWESHWNVFTESASMSSSQDIIFDQLCSIDVSNSKPFSLCSLIRMRGSGSFSDAQRRFAKHVIKTHRGMGSHLDLLLSAIPPEEREQIPELRALMIGAVTAPEAFDSQSPLWNLAGSSAGSSVSGALDDVMELLWNDAAAAEQFIVAVDSEPIRSRPVARLLKTVYELQAPATRNAAATRIRRDFPVRWDDDEAADTGESYPAGLLWQVGQLLDSFDQLEDLLLLKIGVFQAASRKSGTLTPTSSNVSTPDDQLLIEYVKVGRNGLARRGWLAKLDVNTLPRTTGVRENRQLLLAAHVSDNLLKSGFPIDAAGVCRAHLNQLVLFQLARRYSHGRNHRRILETTLQSALDSIDSATAETHLRQLSQDLDDFGKVAVLELYTSSLDKASRSTTDCLLDHAIRIASRTDSGLAAAKGLDDRLGHLAGETDLSLHRHCARLILSAAIRPDRLDADMTKFLDRLPDPDAKQEPTDDSVMQTSDLRLVAGVFAAITRDESQAFPDSLEAALSTLRRIASAKGDESSVLAFSRMSRRSDSMLAFLDAVEDKANGKPLSRVDGEQCLRMAKVAAEKQSWGIVARALRLSLGSGPTTEVSTVAKTVADPYGGTVPTRGAPSIEDPFQKTRTMVLQVLENCRDENGIPISSPQFDHTRCTLEPGELEDLEDSLRQAMFPSEMFVNVYAYHSHVLSLAGVDQINLTGSHRSLSYAAGNLARLRGTTASLMGRIGNRVNASAAPEIVALYVDLALSSGNRVELAEAVSRFQVSYENRLPQLGGASGTEGAIVDKGTPESPKRVILPRGASQILTTADSIVRTLVPVALAEDVPEETRELVTQVLLQTAQLIRSDADLEKSHQKVIEQLEQIALRDNNEKPKE